MSMIFKNLWRRKTRTLLTTLGIAVGVAAVVIFSAFGEGMARGFGQVGESGDADLTVSQKDALMILLGAIDEDIGEQIQQIRGVDEVAGSVVAVLQTPETPYFLVLGEEPRSFAMARYRLIAGQPLNGKRQVLLGKLSATNLKKSVGDTFRMNEIGYRVVGIYETGASFEDNGAVIHLADAQRAFDKKHQVSFFKLKIRDLQQADSIRHAIETRWDELAVTRSGEPMKQDDMLNMYRSMGWFLGLFAILVGGLGMMNAMLMSVFERTREIGVLRALGWRRRRVILMILGESLALSFSGGLLGVGLGSGIVWLASNSSAMGGFLDGSFNPAFFSQAMITALVLGAFGGAYPAWRASQLAPIEAMRVESGATVNWGPVTRLLAYIFRGNALRNIWRRPIRTLMTAIGLGVGVGFVLVLMGITEGSRQLITEVLSAGQADLLVEQANVSDASFSSIDERVADQIRARPEVRSVSSMIFGATSVPGLPFFLVYGLDPREEYISHYAVREGVAVTRPREIMLGRLAANTLKKNLGDTVRVGGLSYRIVGIYENGLAYEDSGGVIVLKEAQRMFRKPRQVSFIGVSLHEPARAVEIAATIEHDIPDIMVSKSSALTDRMQDFATMEAVFGALVALMMLVGGIVMMNVMMMSVFERTQEIGVLRAVGWRRWRVLRMILIESMALSLLSGLAGAGIGVGLTALLGLEPTYGQMLTAIYTPDMFFVVLAMALGLGSIGGLYPAWRAANLRPIDALRYE